MGLLQNPDELAGLADVARGEEGVGGAFVGAAGGAADAVDVVLGGVGVVVVDDELHILHVLKDATRVEGRGVRVGVRKRQTHVGGWKEKKSQHWQRNQPLAYSGCCDFRSETQICLVEASLTGSRIGFLDILFFFNFTYQCQF